MAIDMSITEDLVALGIRRGDLSLSKLVELVCLRGCDLSKISGDFKQGYRQHKPHPELVRALKNLSDEIGKAAVVLDDCLTADFGGGRMQ